MRPHPTTHPAPRWKRFAAVLTAAAVAGVGGVTLATVAAPTAEAADQQAPTCPDPGSEPSAANNVPLFTDNNVTTYVGGTFTAQNRESEGVTVVAGDATFDSPGTYNLGTVGVGSQVAPASGEVMLHVGGDLTVRSGTTLSIGFGLADGGSANVAGSVAGAVDTNGGQVSTPMSTAAALDPYASFDTTIENVSQTLATSATTTPGVVSGAALDLVGDNTGGLHVFDVTVAQLNDVTEVHVSDLAPGTPIAINVTGTGSVTFAPDYFSWNGVRVDDFGAPDNGFGQAATALLWNFVSATDVTLSGGSQILGSILVPNEDSTVHAATHTNGRMYVGGDLVRTGSDTEQHSYAWNGATDFGCRGATTTATGSATITKVLAPGTTVPDGTAFHGTLTSSEGTTGFTVVPGTPTPLDDLALGVEYTVSEDLSATGPGGLTWATPVITVNGHATSTFTLTADAPSVEIGLTNTLLGTFDLSKVVTGTSATTGDFSITWTAKNADGALVDGYLPGADGTAAPVASTSAGTLTIRDGQTKAPLSGADQLLFPVGTIVTFDESAPGALPGYTFQGVTFEPAQVVVGADGASTTVTATNRYQVDGTTFQLRKAVSGPAASLVPADTAFAVTYDVNGVPAAEPLTVLADGTVVDGPALQHGDTVTFHEATPPAVPGVVWGTPVISPDSIVLDASADPTLVTVTNTASYQEATFGLRKVIAGSGASQVPADATFLVTYTVTDGPDKGATGTLTVRADGTVAQGPTLKYGDVVTFDEPTGPHTAGATLESHAFSPATITLGHDSLNPVVTLTNTYSLDDATFRVHKVVTGDGADLVPGSTTFTVRYSVTHGPDAGTEGTLKVRADGTVVDGPVLHHGDVVTFAEATPPRIPGVAWGTPIVTPAQLTLDGDRAPAEVTVTNAATATTGSFAIRKALAGDGAGSVPKDATFTVDYAVNGKPAGTLTIGADGVAVNGPTLRDGSVVTFSEHTPHAVDGVTWQGAKLSAGKITIDGSATQVPVVTVTNTYDTVTSGTGTTAPTQSATGGTQHATGDLATTGANITLVAAGAAILLALGATLLVIGHRRRTQS